MWVRSVRARDNKLSDTQWASQLAGTHPEAPVLLVDERATAQVRLCAW